jgi:putative nucleotidyltransferase with HDIG domain
VAKRSVVKQGEKSKTPKGESPINGKLLRWNKDTQTSLLFWVTVILVTYLLVPTKPFKAADYQPGDIALKDIKATQSFLVEDPSSTRARKLEAENSVLAVYDFDRNQEYEILQQVRTFFQQMREMLATQLKDEKLLIQEVRSSQKPERTALQRELDLFREEATALRLESIQGFIDQLSVDIDAQKLQPLLTDGFSEKVEAILVDSFQPILDLGIVQNRENILRERGKGVTLRTLNTLSEEMVLDDFKEVLSLQSARDLVRKRVAGQGWSRQQISLRRLVEALVQDLIRPNMTFNRSETEERIKKAGEETSAVYHQVSKGEVIVRAGDPLTGDQILKISELKRLSPEVGRTSLVLGMFLLVAITIFSFFMILKIVFPPAAADLRGLFILAVIIVLQVVAMRGVLVLSAAMTATYTGMTEVTLRMVIPFALGAMVTGTLFPETVAVLMATLLSVLAVFYFDWNHTLFLYSFIGGIVAAFSVVSCRQRSSILRAGLAVSGANMIMAAVILLIGGNLFSGDTTGQLLSAAVSGMLVALIASVAIPALESAFNVASDMKLMELGNLNQPALKDMILKAPGSYHHSVLVGSLAEAAAEEIGANPLLARVAATYHDIGKITKPEYFVENQETRDNRHEKLSPSMSALILASHVKDGAEVAKDHRLPRRVVDIIRQHHGTRLITFFYSKAKEMEDPSVQTVDERDFRYPGPKPQSREAALIMLADAVEAASKVLTEPTPARIRGLVQKIINDIFIDGQLDESNLTLRDLHQIARSFTRTVTGILHHRIDYPQIQNAGEERRKEKKKKDDPISEPESGNGLLPEDTDGTGGQNIKRLGQE